MSSTAPVLVSIRDLVKRFGPTTAVDGVSLDVAQGEFLTFLGSSGSGKTTTLFIVAGFEDPTGGDVLIDGRSVLSVAPNKRNIGMVFQRYTLFPHLSVFDNVAFPLAVRRRPRHEIEQAVKETLALVRLEEFAARKPGQLSGGQQQRVALARALVYKPRILLMDEPLAALDKKLREEIQIEIRRIHRELGVTILYVTHDQEEALRLSDRIAVFSHGRVVQVGSGADLYERPADAFVAGFIGNSNFLPARVRGVDAERTAVELPNGAVVAGRTDSALASGGEASLMIRPEKLFLVNGRDAPDANYDCRVDVTLRDSTYLGDSLQREVVTPWGQCLMVRQTGDAEALSHAGTGAALTLCWHSGDARVFRKTAGSSAPRS
ncbi:ABC transporter ATP-binding protein [Rhodospirillaceae bacterium SYSU D60014]|uniref:ABC transporter ATP-binding protein n=1 Tax=Virgifigura deserti TaxID=2268457 RepID=UPI000E66FA8E